MKKLIFTAVASLVFLEGCPAMVPGMVETTVVQEALQVASEDGGPLEEVAPKKDTDKSKSRFEKSRDNDGNGKIDPYEMTLQDQRKLFEENNKEFLKNRNPRPYGK